MVVEEGLNFLREHSTGSCKKSGKTFGEVIDHFIVGYDEANMTANADGSVRIVGEFGRKKHEKIASDCRTSCTVGRSGSAADDNGPTSFIMAEQHAASSIHCCQNFGRQ